MYKPWGRWRQIFVAFSEYFDFMNWACFALLFNKELQMKAKTNSPFCTFMQFSSRVLQLGNLAQINYCTAYLPHLVNVFWAGWWVSWINFLNSLYSHSQDFFRNKMRILCHHKRKCIWYRHLSIIIIIW